MKRISWVTDIHLNFLNDRGVQEFAERLLSSRPDAVLIGGDIAEAHSVGAYLFKLEEYLRRPIYFVLGNHDFYRGSIAEVRERMTMLSSRSQWLRWLPAAGLVELTEETGLLGHDGWADGRFGDYANSGVMLNDYLLIEDLAGLDSPRRLAKINALGDESAAYLETMLPRALDRFRCLVVLLHVPPFEEACWHEGKVSDKNYLPHFSCKAVGEVLAAAMKDRLDRSMTVLCGHTHGSGEVRILPNLLVRTGGAVYGRPQVQDVLEVF